VLQRRGNVAETETATATDGLFTSPRVPACTDPISEDRAVGAEIARNSYFQIAGIFVGILDESLEPLMCH
jgi:hypothetical protein